MSLTSIEWTHIPGTVPETWNPTTGCNKVSAGCKNCYAEVMHKRLSGMGQKKYTRPFLQGAITHNETLEIPLGWKKPRTVFVNSMSDLFHEDIEFEFINAVFSVMSDCDKHTYLILTKRPERLLEFFKWKHLEINRVTNYNITWQPKPNVWLGVSCENQATADERIPLLLKVPVAVRFLSCEPLLEGIDLQRWLFRPVFNGAPSDIEPNDQLHWVIAGGESGHKARPIHPDWVRSLKNQCKDADVPFFFKQWGEWIAEEKVEKDFWVNASEAKESRNNIYLDIIPVNGTITQCSMIEMRSKGQTVPILYNRVGKHASGRLLDGIEYNEFPKPLINE